MRAAYGIFPLLRVGRARQLCPATLDLDFLCNVEGVVDLDA
jgi:hypothetical protein